jgi:glutathione S-transferase
LTIAILYGAPFSLFTGRARSYLIKAHVPYRETMPITEHYIKNIVPAAGNRQSMPTLELPDGEVIRDGVAIIDHFETKSGHGFSPATPKQRVINRLLDVIGAEGLLRPAMHYRWNFPEQNLEFLRFHFQTAMPRGPGREEKADMAMNRMRAAGQAFGAVPDTFDTIETLYIELLKVLDSHFSEHPYLLGGKPSIADFGMLAPLYAHLGRDPKPLSLMREHALHTFRWVERMNRPELDVGEFETQDSEYLASDEIPATLVNVLKHIAIDFVPETRAAASCINDWISQQDNLESGTECARGVGMANFQLRGVTTNALAQPFRFYLLKRVQDEFESLDNQQRDEVTSLLDAFQMTDILKMKLSRNIGRQNNLEVWL